MIQFKVWNLRENFQEYKIYLEKCLYKTPYHLPEYLLAEEKAENDRVKVFLYEEDEKFALFPEVIRKINRLVYMRDIEESTYDMITPHEYGGIISNNDENIIKEKLIKNICDYCKKNNIVFQFVRINPYLTGLTEIFKLNGFEIIYSNSQVYIDLRQEKKKIIGEYKSNVRRNIKRAEKEGLKFEIGEKSENNIIAFQNMYQKAMKILKARKFLYFNLDYFQTLLKCNCSRLGLVKDKNDNILAAGIMLLEQDIVYYHLGCFDREYSLQRPMNYLIHSMILWSKDKNYKIYHLGGGSENLMQFKGGYSNTRIDYYIANKVCNIEKYIEICEKWKKKFQKYIDINYYPLYRYNEDLENEER